MKHLAGKGVRVQLSTHLSARVVYTTDTPTSLYDGGAYTGSCIRVMGISVVAVEAARPTEVYPVREAITATG